MASEKSQYKEINFPAVEQAGNNGKKAEQVGLVTKT